MEIKEIMVTDECQKKPTNMKACKRCPFVGYCKYTKNNWQKFLKTLQS